MDKFITLIMYFWDDGQENSDRVRNVNFSWSKLKILENFLKEKGVSVDSKLFQKITKFNCKVFLALDPDAREREIEIAKKLLGYGIRVNKIEIPNEYKDIGEMSKERFQEVKRNNTLELTNDNLLGYNLDMI